MFKVISPFRDKYNPRKVYQVGEPFHSDDEERIKDLLNRKLIEGVSSDTPFFDDAEDQDYQKMTKKELQKLLEQKGIEYSQRQTKDELIQLLLGGE